METPAIPDSLKSGIKLPILQTWLILAGAITQLSVWTIPKYTSLPKLSERFCERAHFITDISEEEKQLLQNFQAWIILANHPNKIMADFPPWIRYLAWAENIPVRIWTGISVNPMYSTLLPNNCETFLAELRKWRSQDREKIEQWIKESIDFVKNEVWILILSWFSPWKALQKRILSQIPDTTDILEVTTEFPEEIGYMKRLWANSMYGRIFNPFTPEMEVQVGVEKKTRMQLSNR